MNLWRWGLLLGCLTILASMFSNVAVGQQRQRGSRVRQASHYEMSPFGWQAGDAFDGCGGGGDCGPICSGGDCGPVCDDFCGGECLEYADLGCSQTIFEGSCAGCKRWSAGVEFAVLKPHFGGNTAFTALSSNGTTEDSFAVTEFDYDNELTPRVWLEVLNFGNLGMRVRYWQFDHNSATAIGTPDENGFGRIIPPDFGDIDLSTSIPGSTYTADAELLAYTIDLEATSSFDFGCWAWMATAGLRFAEIEQGYVGNLSDENGTQQGSVNFNHRIQGIGPVLGIRTQRPFLQRLALFGVARGSLLFGDNESNLLGLEDLDLQETMTTQRVTARDTVLPIGEVMIGLQWIPISCGCLHPYLHVAMEGQVWGEAGNSSSEEGDLGFYGVNAALGFDW